MVCNKCGNEDPKYFAYDKNNRLYCRKCISFMGKKAEKNNSIKSAPLKLDYDLSLEQKNISAKIKDAINNKQNVFLYAVTGAGKTELVYESIEDTLKKHLQVGFVVPRKDVVIDLLPRFQSAFPSARVRAIYGGNHEILEGDILLLTTHQLYRYENYFDLLIFDEIDAFPYEGNDMLTHFFYKAVRGNYILMSATPKKNMIDDVLKSGGNYLELTKRYHGHPLPIPEIKLSLMFQKWHIIKTLKTFHVENKPCFIFCPTINEAEDLYKDISKQVPNGEVVHSKKKDRDKIIEDFKNGKYEYLITTSILERGVTVKNLQVLIYHANHELFDSSTLIQISGRVGRKKDAPEGKVIYFADSISSPMEESIQKIKDANV